MLTSMAISPYKRAKTLTSTSDPIIRSQDQSGAEKGTSLPIVEDDSSDRCGICLSEAGNGEVSRGCIDSCNHYYCFVCIVEWAKVESKCPLCKLRFSTIRRPPKPPVFLSDRVIHVPLRDQAYHYHGNVSVGPPNPYSEVKCSVCHGITDESLLLLCDLCDSGAHTYCVGLGLTVPEGDWYCQDCALLREEHSKSESDSYPGIQTKFGTAHEISNNEHVSVSDIVQESRGHEVQRSRSASSDPCSLPRLPPADDGTTILDNINHSSSTRLEIVAQRPPKPNTRTLQHCRNLHDRILLLRENWNSFRSGKMCFSSSQSDSNMLFSQKSPTFKSCGQPSVSCLNKNSVAQCRSSDITNDIQKAWKMMDKAKSLKQEHQRSRVIFQASKCEIKKPKAVENADFKSHRHLAAGSQQNGLKNVDPGQRSLEKDFYEQQSLVSGKGKGKRHVVKDGYYHGKDSISSHSPILKLSKDVQSPSYIFDAIERSEKLPADGTVKGADCSVALEPVLHTNQVREVNHASSSNNMGKHPKETSKLESFMVGSQQYNDAKSEIQSLVKLNLKLQTKKEKLEVGAFKEVARAATHCILAACGLEHRHTACTSIPGFVCPHPHNLCSPMPNSCSKCFYVFVEDVVTKVMLQKNR